jgi:hypothetical protein
MERGKTSGRSDDNMEALVKRFKTFTETSMPVVKHLDALGLLKRVNAEGPIEEVYGAARSLFSAPAAAADPLLADFFAKDEVTICVTDVGLGGLSVMSEIERRLQDNPLFPKVNLLYYNSAVTPGYTQRPA